MFNSFHGGTHMTSKVLRLPKVINRVGLSRSTIYAKITRGEFPPPIKLGLRAVGWPRASIDEWIEHQVEKSERKS